MKGTRTISVLLVLFFSSSFIRAQDPDKVFEEFRQKQQQAYAQFKKKADEDFAAFLEKAWERFEAKEPIPAPLRPEPVKPVVFDDKKPTTPPVQVKPKVPSAEKPVTKPLPGVYVPDQPYTPVEVDKPTVSPIKPANRTEIRFYGTPFYIATDAVKQLSLNGIGEKEVANAWTQLCKANHEQFINDCMTVRDEKGLNDWGYVMLTKQIGEQLYGSRRSNEIAFLQMFILSKSGYKVRLSKVNEQLQLLVAPASVMYGLPYITLEEVKYYLTNPPKQAAKNIYTYPEEFPGSKNYIDLAIKQVPDFTHVAHTKRYESKNGIAVQTMVNKNLVDFYKDYPLCGVPVHYHTPMSDALRTSLYPALQDAIRGKSQKEAANILITFVQTAFDYMTDGEQFGYEKPNFLEENFFYPYNDCEDRAMLYATMVKELLGLDVVLLDYPEHIASAIRFTEEIAGDNVLIDGKKYLICDPTYIGASIGMCMSQYKQVAPEIIR